MLTLTLDNFDATIQNEKEKLVMVEFWAPWCTYCKRISAAFDAIAAEYEQDIVIGKVNIDEAMDIAVKYQVLLIPTVLIFRNGEPVGRIVNPPSKAAIEAFITDKSSSEAVLDPTIYDTLVIGGGPAGYTAALYCTRAGLKTLVLEKVSAGGQMAQTTMIDNYPGFPQGIDGFELGQKMQQGAERFGAKTILAEVKNVELSGKLKLITTDKNIFQAKTVIVATGALPKQLGNSREQEFIGRGIHYCAACDGMTYKDKTVAVIGGGNSAVADALVLARICKKVIIVHRRDTLRATQIYHKQLESLPNVEFAWNSVVEEIAGENHFTGLVLKNTQSGALSTLNCDTAFVSIGRTPATQLFYGILDTDEAGYIKADETTKTNIAGVFAVGDVRTKALRQVVTAVADGAVASHYIEEYLL